MTSTSLSKPILAQLRPNLGPSWAYLGLPRALKIGIFCRRVVSFSTSRLFVLRCRRKLLSSPFGRRLGPILGHLGLILGPLGAHLGLLGASWGPSWRPSVNKVYASYLMKAILSHLGPASLHFGPDLEPTWGCLGPPWGPLGGLPGASHGIFVAI